MSRMRRTPILVGLAGLVLLLVPVPVLAYGGPGSVVSGIGTLLAAVAALVAAALGFVWFPLKRLYGRLFGRSGGEGEGEERQEGP